MSTRRQNSSVCLHAFQGEYEFSPEILSGKLAEVVYRDATGKINGRFPPPISSVTLNFKTTDVYNYKITSCQLTCKFVLTSYVLILTTD